MEYKKEHLDVLLDVIDKISKTSGNEWFFNALVKKYQNNFNDNFNNSSEIVYDLRRTYAYLSYVDKKFYQEAIQYYKNIIDKELKTELLKDYKMMKIAEVEKDLVEYTRRIVMQIENCFTFLIVKLNAWDLIKNTPNNFKKNSTNLFDGQYSFFTNGIKDAEDQIPDNRNGIMFYKKKISKIALTTKRDFFTMYYNNLSINYKDFNDLSFLRNKASHRGKSDTDVQRVQDLCQEWDQNQRRFFKILNDIIKKLLDLY